MADSVSDPTVLTTKCKATSRFRRMRIRPHIFTHANASFIGFPCLTDSTTKQHPFSSFSCCSLLCVLRYIPQFICQNYVLLDRSWLSAPSYRMHISILIDWILHISIYRFSSKIHKDESLNDDDLCICVIWFLTAVKLKCTVVRDVTTCTSVNVYPHRARWCCIHLQGRREM
jgi:hypothetical protein